MAKPSSVRRCWPCWLIANFTNSHAASGCLLSFEITKPALLTLVAGPAGPVGMGATSHLKSSLAYSGTTQWPIVVMAATPAAHGSPPYSAAAAGLGIDLSAVTMESIYFQAARALLSPSSVLE